MKALSLSKSAPTRNQGKALRPLHRRDDQRTIARQQRLARPAGEFRETQIIPLIKKQTGQANVNGTALKNMLIPFHPFLNNTASSPGSMR